MFSNMKGDTKMTYTIHQDFMDVLNAMIECYDTLTDYYPDRERYWGTWLTLREIRDMITDPKELEAKKQIFLNE